MELSRLGVFVTCVALGTLARRENKRPALGIFAANRAMDEGSRFHNYSQSRGVSHFRTFALSWPMRRRRTFAPCEPITWRIHILDRPLASYYKRTCIDYTCTLPFRNTTIRGTFDIEQGTNSRTEFLIIMSEKAEENAKPDVDETLIEFDGPDDPYMPLNWPMRKKMVVTMLYSFCTMGTTWASTMYASLR